MSQKFQSAKDAFGAFCELVEQLRNPESGCPWDLKQTHQTLAKYMIEEAYESATAMQEDVPAKICDELGDVLLQVVLNAQIAADQQSFKIDDVIQAIHTKMVRRHPHVFGSAEDRQARAIPQIMQKWEEIKRAEKGGVDDDASYMEEKGVHKIFPATTQAYKIGKAAHAINFDWSSPGEVFDVLISEIQELKEEWQRTPAQRQMANVYAELGDVYFALAQFCRHLNREPELVAHDGNLKFLRRFKGMEKIAKDRNVTLAELRQDELEALWETVKSEEAKPQA